MDMSDSPSAPGSHPSIPDDVFARLHACPILCSVIDRYFQVFLARLPDASDPLSKPFVNTTSFSPLSTTAANTAAATVAPASSYGNLRSLRSTNSLFSASFTSLSTLASHSHPHLSPPCPFDDAGTDDDDDDGGGGKCHYCIVPSASFAFSSITERRHADIGALAVEDPAPSLACVTDRVQRVFARSGMSRTARLHALCLLAELERQGDVLSATSALAAVIACALLAAKSADDDPPRDNAFFAATVGLPLSAVNDAETAIFRLLDYHTLPSRLALNSTAAHVLVTATSADPCLARRLEHLGVSFDSTAADTHTNTNPHANTNMNINTNSENDCKNPPIPAFRERTHVAIRGENHNESEKELHAHRNDDTWCEWEREQELIEAAREKERRQVETQRQRYAVNMNMSKQSACVFQYVDDVVSSPESDNFPDPDPNASLSTTTTTTLPSVTVKLGSVARLTRDEEPQSRATGVYYCDDNFIL